MSDKPAKLVVVTLVDKIRFGIHAETVANSMACRIADATRSVQHSPSWKEVYHETYSHVINNDEGLVDWVKNMSQEELVDSIFYLGPTNTGNTLDAMLCEADIKVVDSLQFHQEESIIGS